MAFGDELRAGLARPRPARLALAAGIAAAGLWIGSQTLAANVAKRDLDRAAGLAPADAGIAGARARARIDAGDAAGAVPLARRALRRDPTIVPAVQTLGLAAEGTGDRARAARLLAYAQRLSRRDLQTHLWAIETHVARGDTARVIVHYDLALRTSLPARDILFPILGGAVAEPAIAGPLTARMAARPAWAEPLVAYLAGDRAVDPHVAVRFLAVARRGGVPVPATAAAALSARALEAGDAATAWAAYQLARPGADRRSVRDPGFARIPADPAPFDWSLGNDGSILSHPVVEGGRGRLEIEAGSGAVGPAAHQMQMLPPGRYRLVADAGAIAPGARLVWTLGCREGAELMRLTITGPARRHVGPPFAVPPRCPVQALTLTADASESAEGLMTAVSRVAIVPAAGLRAE